MGAILDPGSQLNVCITALCFLHDRTYYVTDFLALAHYIPVLLAHGLPSTQHAFSASLRLFVFSLTHFSPPG